MFSNHLGEAAETTDSVESGVRVASGDPYLIYAARTAKYAVIGWSIAPIASDTMLYAAVAPNGQLIVMGKRSRYVEGDLWTRIGQELNDGAMFPDSSSNKEDDEEVASDTQVGYKASALALRLSPQTSSIESYYPTKQHFRILWPIYLSNIRPVTMILHAPSAGEKLTKAVEGHGNMSRIAVTDVRNFDVCPHVCHGC
ncbi:hypothetical protein BDV30DRAFT_228851 [Aspergillus minisclerotigenes]|uniref:Uncharacterized protein n=1 Tax=Aspergillus minisclerotigenes TaxID=656917 RepID=A0A5N6IVM7_9EURO|nr:hypothetical protein BDV30DRAFT_228851 [Aspergillus minisclerotigenes]